MSKQTTVVTNIRVASSDWNQIKAAAGEMGMSVNQYVNRLIKALTAQRELGVDILGLRVPRKKLPVWELHKLAKEAKPLKGGLSENDQAVYGK
jgi:hypothetical protein